MKTLEMNVTVLNKEELLKTDGGGGLTDFFIRMY